jgi:ATP-binding cassette subfamily B protein
MKKIKSLISILGYYPKYSPVYFALDYLQIVVNSIISIFNSVYLLKIVFDSFEGKISIQNIILVLIIVIIANSFMMLFNNWFSNVYAPKCELKIRENMQKDIFNKASQIPLKYYDDNDFYDKYILALRESSSICHSVLSNTGALLRNIISIATIILILLTIDFYIVLLICLSVLLGFFIDIILAKKSVKKDLNTLKLKRKLDYYKRIFYLKEYIEEIKTLPKNEFLFEEYNRSFDELHTANKKYSKPLITFYILKGIIDSLLTSFAIYFLLIYRLVISKVISIGDFSAAVNSTWRLSNNLTQIVSNITNIYKNATYCEKLLEFQNIAIENNNYSLDIGLPFPTIPQKIEVKNVFFSYDGENQILNNISLSINPYQKIAIVGENGSGKSTLVNILLNLYSDYDGTIFLDGMPIVKYNNTRRYDYFSCLFQDFNIYAISLKENVAMNYVENDFDMQVKIALLQAGLEEKLISLPNGLDTIIAKEYDDTSVELSGGEKQKVALARMLISKSCVLILDEPSSALDPVSESHFNNLLMSAFNDRTVIFISHRFFSTRKADNIFLLADGSIKESGTHEQLMKLGGQYAKMYNLQKEKYIL